MTHDDRLRESIARLDRGRTQEFVIDSLNAALTRARSRESPASDATCPPDATETPADTRAGEQASGTTCRRCEASLRAAVAGVLCEPPHARLHDFERETDAGGMDNQGAELDRLRAEVAQREEWYADLHRRTLILDGLLAKERAKVAAGLAAVDNMPLIVSGILRDIELTPQGRGGALHHDPATPGHGASGCPGDNLARWPDEIRAALAGDA